MHFKTLVLAGLASLAAVAALPSGSAHGGHTAPRHHRFIRPRKVVEVDPVSAKKAKATTRSTTQSAKFTSTKSTKVTSTKGVKPTGTKDEEEPTETDTTEPSAPTAGTGGINIGDKLLAVFPAGLKTGMARWSTNPAVSGALALNDQTLRASKQISKLPASYVNFAGKKAMKVNFEKGSYAYRGSALGGVSKYALGPANQKIDNAKVITFSYSIQFSEGFSFNRGGKLPGLYGGTNEEEAAGCSGGNARATCWSMRYMWRANGVGELYAYLPSDAKSTNKKAVCNNNPTCDEDYGWSLGRSTWKWTPGTWQTIAQKITLNDVGKANGSVETYIDGRKVYTADNIMIRTRENATPRGAMVQSFFGGHDADWASPKDQQIYFADFSVAVLETD